MNVADSGDVWEINSKIIGNKYKSMQLIQL